MDPLVARAMEEVLAERPLDRATLLALTQDAVDGDDVLYAANKIRKHFVGQRVHCCSIVNARSGKCSEDCKFCAQSAHFATGAPVYDLLSTEEIVAAAREARDNGARCFGVVTSGRGVRDADLPRFCEIYRALRGLGLRLGGSLGVMTFDQARQLREAGMEMINHNLETSRRMFPRIVRTHTYDERLDTLRAAKQAGMILCSGGIFGMGETWEDRIDMLLELAGLGVQSVPLNFLHRIPGTPLEHVEPLSAQEILRSIALARFILPKAEIRICGGRSVNLRDLQSWIFHAGASGALIGNYLTTMGRTVEDDWQMIRDLGLASAAVELPVESVTFS